MSECKAIIWGLGIDYDKYINLIHYQELLGNLEIVGITGEKTIYAKVDNYSFVKKEELLNLEFDIIIVVNDDEFLKIRKEITERGIDKSKVVHGKVFSLPNFNMKKYMSLLKNPLTIFSNNCWGGIVYNRLGLEFHSPLINMFESDGDFLKLLKNPQKYMQEELVLKRYEFSPALNREYPICSCGDIFLFFNHYKTFEEAVECWNKRKKRINWDNIMAVMYTENENVAKEFANLPYQKKICFVPFETQNENLVYIDYRNEEECKEIPFWRIMNGLALGSYKYYNLVDLLCDAKIEKRVE